MKFTAAPEVESDRKPAGGRRIRHTVLTAVLLAAVAVGVVAAIRDGGGHAVALLLRAQSVPYVLAAFATSGAGLLLQMASWRRVLVEVGGPIGPLDSARIYFTGLLGKFVPGPVWGVVAHIQMGRTLGVPAAGMTAAFFLSLGVTTLTGTTVGLIVAPSVLGGNALWLALPLAATAACLARPGLVNLMVTTLLRVTRRPYRPAAASDRAVRGSIGLGLASWAVSGLHLWIIATLLGASPVRSLPVCVGAFSLAAIAGGFAVIMPDGAGAREAVLMVALATVLPWSSAGVAALASRMVLVVSEVAGAGIFLAIGRTRGHLRPLPRTVQEEGNA